MTETISRRYERVVAAAIEKPWAILPAKLALLAEVLALRLDGQRFSDDEILERVGAKPKRNGGQSTGSVAVIPVYGTIVPRGASFSDISMGQGTSLEQLIGEVNTAAADGNVSAILLDIDSPGGQVDMVPEAAAALRSARAKKPLVAVANTMAASAAYWLFSQAREGVITPSGEVGSIGVFAVHSDLSKQLEMLGISPTIIKAGKYKAELSPFQPLTEEARAYAQQGVDTFYSMFTRDVAAGRGANVNDVRAGFGEGRMVTAQQAVAQGMADKVDTFDNTLARLMSGGGVAGGRAAAVDQLVADPPVYIGGAQVKVYDGNGDPVLAVLEAAVEEEFGVLASDEEASGSMPQDKLAELRRKSRAAVLSERSAYLSTLRRMK